jgi:alpha-amylase
MGKKLKLVFAIHNHQPVGNFDHVFSECFNKCYKPFLSVLKRHPTIKISIHFTGPLLEWIRTNQNEYFDELRHLIKKGQLEMLGGGFYEPILSILPKSDAIGQIKMQSDYLQKHFDQTPSGVWLAERIWDGSTPEILSTAGIDYTIIDDTHFKYAGFNQENINGYYVSERLGHKVNVFPIDKNLRYMIPFADPQKIIDYLGLCAERNPNSSVCYADDGEKFGVWPETFNTCYEERWLDRFFDIIEENNDWIEVVPAGEVLKEQRSNGLAYLPNASYEEMLEWALPLNAAYRYKLMKKSLEGQHIYGQVKDFIRGGIWPNFLVKYPESNLMYRKMLRVSNYVNSAKVSKEVKERAKDELYKGQCNCSYWHGLFGGLYLNYLRHSIYHHLMTAERIINSNMGKPSLGRDIVIKEEDYTCNGLSELVVENADFFYLFDPNCGGALVELDYKPKTFNLSNVMTRRKEAYHLDLARNDHENSARVDEFYYDKYSRYSFMDHFFAESTRAIDLLDCSYKEDGDFIGEVYETVEKSKNSFVLKRDGTFGDSKLPVTITKSFNFASKGDVVDVEYEIANNSSSDIDTTFGVEFNFTLLAGRDDGRFYEVNDEQLEGDKRYLVSVGESTNVNSVAMVDLWSGIRIRIATPQNVCNPKNFHYSLKLVGLYNRLKKRGYYEQNHSFNGFVGVLSIC